jgi:mannitol-1-phosphate/altronate dehydrogenase
MERLSPASLRNSRPAAGVEFPTYDRNALKTGIVHFGPGNFPLAHIAATVDELLRMGDEGAFNYGIAVVSTQTPHRRDQLLEQGGLYTIVEQDRAGQHKMTVVGSVIDAIYGPDNPARVLVQLAAADTRIVSMTITPDVHQSFVDANGHLNFQNPGIIHDLNPANAPRTVIGYIVRAVQARRDAGLPGLSIVNLDNMVGNGDKTGGAVRQFALAFDPSKETLKEIEAGYSFPNSMVDRIVPKTSPSLLKQVADKIGLEDLSAVPAEPMPSLFWALEDNFVNGRPAWERTGVKIVPSAEPYEKLKLRMLNVTHSMMACLGDLAGYERIDEVMNDRLFAKAIRTLMKYETGPTTPEMFRNVLEAYGDETCNRFANEKVRDTTQRVATDAPLAVVIENAVEQLDNGGVYEMLALNVAAWMRRFAIEKNENGGDIVTRHAVKDQLLAKAKEGGNNPEAVVASMFSLTGVFGKAGEYPEFVEAVKTYMTIMDHKSIGAAIDAAINASDHKGQ